MIDRTVIYVFQCECWIEHEESQLASEMTKEERAHIYKIHGVVDARRRYCKKHCKPMDYRICYCIECSDRIDYKKGGKIPERCPECAAERIRNQRNAASARQRARRKAGIVRRRAKKMIKRGDYCRFNSGCEVTGRINGSQSACLKCSEFIPLFKGVDPVQISETMGAW